MSDVMLLAVLRMSSDLWIKNSPIDEVQRQSRYLQAANKIERMDKVINRIITESSLSEELLIEAQKALDT